MSMPAKLPAVLEDLAVTPFPKASPGTPSGMPPSSADLRGRSEGFPLYLTPGQWVFLTPPGR